MTQVWAHRGSSGHAPENTIPAFELALEQGADGVEFDVQLSRDGVPVVIHDETVDRTTNGHGWVRDLTAAQLGELDASGGRAGFARAHVPTLAEVLDLFAPTNLLINIELKNTEVPYPGMEEKVLAEVRERQLESRVVFSSFNIGSLAVVRGLGTSAEIAVLVAQPNHDLPPYVPAEGMTAIHPHTRLLRVPGFLARCRAQGLTVRVWPVNDAAALRRMCRTGVDGVFTDFPDLALWVRSGRC